MPREEGRKVSMTQAVPSEMKGATATPERPTARKRSHAKLGLEEGQKLARSWARAKRGRRTR